MTVTQIIVNLVGLVVIAWIVWFFWPYRREGAAVAEVGGV